MGILTTAAGAAGTDAAQTAAQGIVDASFAKQMITGAMFSAHMAELQQGVNQIGQATKLTGDAADQIKSKA